MTTSGKKTIELLPSGVPGLDVVLGGGLPEYSFNLIAGDPGAGKTTLVQQIVFARATVEAPALYFTVLGEPPLKMLRHAQQFRFFDQDKVNGAVRFVNLSSEAMNHDLDSLMQRMLVEVETIQPRIVVVDSFRTVARASSSEAQLQEFVQRLALHLTGWQATTFLVGEYGSAESHANPIFTIADGILWLTQSIERNASVRRMQVTKMRACSPMPGLHTFVISAEGIHVFPQILPRAAPPARPRGSARASTGIAGLDAMMGGGIPAGESALFVGPSGSGKSLFARHFIAAGAEAGERGIIAVFEEHPGEYIARADAFGPKLSGFVERGLVEVMSLRSLDLTVDETLAAVRGAVERTKARRLAIDSLSGFELSLAPSHRDDIRESIFRTITALTGLGITVLMTVDMVQSFTELTLSPHITEFLADVLVLQRYVELDGRLEKVLAVVKMRSSEHDTAIRRYAIGPSGVIVGETEHRPQSMLTGVPIIVPGEDRASALPGLTRLRRLKSGGALRRKGMARSRGRT